MSNYEMIQNAHSFRCRRIELRKQMEALQEEIETLAENLQANCECPAALFIMATEIEPFD